MARRQRQLEGYLAKEGNVGLGKGRLKRRWFVLQGFELHYYKSNEKGKSLGFIPMEKVTAINIVEDQKKRESMSLKTRQSQTLSGDSAYPFDLVTKERIYHLVAESHQSLFMWVEGLNETMTAAQALLNASAITPPGQSSVMMSAPPPSASPAPTPTPTPASDSALSQQEKVQQRQERYRQQLQQQQQQQQQHDVASPSPYQSFDQQLSQPTFDSQMAAYPPAQYQDPFGQAAVQPSVVDTRRSVYSDPVAPVSTTGTTASQRYVAEDVRPLTSSSGLPASSAVDMSRITELLDSLTLSLQQSEASLNAEALERLLIDLRELVSGLPRAEREPNEIDNQSAKLNKLRGLTVQEIQMLQRLQKLSEEIRQLQDSCNARVNERDRLKLELDSNVSSLRSEKERLGELEVAITKTAAQISKFDLDTLARGIRELQQELEQLPRQIDEVMRTVLEAQGDIARLEAEKEVLAQRLAHTPGILRDLEQREEVFRRNLDDLKNILAELEARRAAILEQIAQLEKQKKGLANREKMLGVLKNIIEDESWDDLVSTFTLVSSLEKQASSLVDELTDDPIDFSTDGNDAELGLKKKQESIRAKARLFESRVEAERFRLQQEDARLQQELRDVEEEIARLKREREALLKNVHEITAARLEADQQGKQLESDISGLALRISGVQQRKADAEEQIEQLQKTRIRKHEQLEKELERQRTDSAKLAQLQAQQVGQQRERAETAERLQQQYLRMAAQLQQLEKTRRDAVTLMNQLHAHAERQDELRSTYRHLVQQRKNLLDEIRADVTALLDAAYLRLGERRPPEVTAADRGPDPELTQEVSRLRSLLVQREAELAASRDNVAAANRTAESLKRQLDEQRAAFERDTQSQRRTFELELEQQRESARHAAEQQASLASLTQRDASDTSPRSVVSPTPLSPRGVAPAGDALVSELLRAKEEEIEREQDARKKLYKQLKQLRQDLNAKTTELQEAHERIRVLERDAKQSAALASALGMPGGGGGGVPAMVTSPRSGVGAVETLYASDTIAALEKELLQKDTEIATLTASLIELQSNHEEASSNLASLQSRIRQQIDEIKAKDASITSLSSVIRGIDPNSTQQNDLGQLQREIGRLRMAIQAHQMQNSELAYELRRIDNEKNSIQQAKTQAVTELTRQLERVRAEYNALRHKLLNNQLDASSGSQDSASDSEFQELKREYFYSLAISAKLNLSMQGRYCNVDASRLFDEVVDTIPFKQWHSWLTQRMLDDSMALQQQSRQGRTSFHRVEQFNPDE